MIQGPQCSTCGQFIDIEMADENDGRCRVCSVNGRTPATDVLRQAQAKPARCIERFDRITGTPILSTLYPEEENLTWQLACPCGTRLFELHGYLERPGDRPEDREAPDPPLSARCIACGKQLHLFDPRIDGYDAEIGHPRDTTGKGDAIVMDCDCCGKRAGELAVSLEYAFDLDALAEDNPEIAEHGQDFFTCIDLFYFCESSGDCIHVVRHSSVAFEHDAAVEDHEITDERYFADPDAAMALREAHYQRWFGPLSEPIQHSLEAKPVHVDIYQFPPTGERDYWTLITGGMSDLRQVVPETVEDASGRTEIMMYVEEPKPWMFDVLKGLAEMPFDQDTCLHWHHTVPNGVPMTAEPSELTSFFFLPPYFEDEPFDTLEIEGEKIDFLWLIPITEKERHFAIDYGSQALEDEMMEQELDPVVDEGRSSIV